MKNYRMNLKRYFAQLGIARFIIAAIILGFVWFQMETTGAVVITVSVVLILAIVWGQFALTRVDLGGDTITQRGGFLPRKTLSFSSLAPAVYVAQYIEPGFGVFKRLLLRDNATGKKLSLSSLQWDETTITDIIKRLEKSGVQIETIEDPATIQQLAKTHPAYLSLIERRPYLFAILIVLGLIAVIAAGVLIFR